MSKIVASAAVLAALALVPVLGDTYLMRIATLACMYAVMATSWNLIGGLTGYPSFGIAAFFGLGAYASGILVTMGVPLAASVALAGVVALVFAAVIGVILLRLKGHYFAIATLATVELLREIANSATDLTGGGMGLNIPRNADLGIYAEASLFFFMMWTLLALTIAVCLYVERSKIGFALGCIRQAEGAAEMIGVNSTFYKTLAFALSGVFVAMAGAIYASWVHYIEPGDVFDILLTIKPVVMALIGGVGSTVGAMIGAVVYIVAEEVIWRNYLDFSSGIIGLTIVGLVLFLPRGIGSLRLRMRRKVVAP
jgi:branched-chain amino acid transport system permease protein